MDVIQVSVPLQNGLTKPVRIELVPNETDLMDSGLSKPAIRTDHFSEPERERPEFSAPRGFVPHYDQMGRPV